MEVEVVSQVLGGHGRAFDVPARAAGAEVGLPVILAGLGGFPEGEVAGRVLVVLVDVDTGAVGDAGEVLLGQLAVVRERGDAEIPGAIVGAVGGILRGQLLDEGNHRGDVLSGAGNDLRLLDGEGVEVFEEGFFEAGSVLADGYPGSRGVTDDLVVDVGNVHDVAGGDSLQPEEAAQHVDLEKGPEVTDVAV